MRIRGIDGWSSERLEEELAAGGRFVFYEYCVSLIVFSMRRPSEAIYLRPGEKGLVRGLPYTLLSLLLGWWGLPWGFIYTPLAIITNFAGGCDITAQVRKQMKQAALLQTTAPYEGASCEIA